MDPFIDCMDSPLYMAMEPLLDFMDPLKDFMDSFLDFLHKCNGPHYRFA